MISLYVMSVFYVVAGVNHFWSPAAYRAVMPPYIPYPEAMVILSGVAEIFLGLLLLVPRFRKLAAWGVILLLIAVSPVHIFMLQEHDSLFQNIPLWALVIRLPLQMLLIYWAYRQSRINGESPATRRRDHRLGR